jgi:hypothetical protein
MDLFARTVRHSRNEPTRRGRPPRGRVFGMWALALVWLCTEPALAEGGPDADAIMDGVLARGAFGWEGARTRVRMVLEAKSGESRERVMDVLGRRSGGQLESVVRFVSPADVAGMAFLMREQADGRSEQHVYLPRLRRTRRIAGREREGSFMGSDFSYADFERRDLQGARHRRLDDDTIGNHAVYVVESVPRKPSEAQYSKIVSYVRKSDGVPLRTRFHDGKGKLLKTLYIRSVRSIGGHPVVMRARMHNHQNGHVTVLIVESVDRQDSFPAGTFTPTALERG